MGKRVELKDRVQGEQFSKPKKGGKVWSLRNILRRDRMKFKEKWSLVEEEAL